MFQAVRRLPLPFTGARPPRLAALLQALAQAKPGPIATVAAALVMSVAVMTGALDWFDRRLSDAWFGLAEVAPSGRIVFVTFDRSDVYGIRVTRRDLAELLSQLDAAGASRILIEAAMVEQANAAEDAAFERVLAKLGRKVGFTAVAVVAANQTSWRRAGVLDRYARHATRTASDIGIDPDGQIRRSGIEDSGLPYLVPTPAWLIGAKPTRSTDVFRIDFGIDSNAFPSSRPHRYCRGGQQGLPGRTSSSPATHLQPEPASTCRAMAK